ncbi:MAG TPA: winged helix-turn-helix domain-containing protein, partial [Candidatus Nitrosopolaris sp.]|nr:winged helix-turn-helix domain-containing protein [Candidatus Nitrosopolaris sp.]
MENRSRDEITARILQAANKGSTKTEIMYETFLTHDKLSEYCVVLIENDLIAYQRGERTYKTTEKGLSFLRDHREAGCRITRPSTSNLLHFEKVLVVGLGQLGLPVAKYVKERGFDTYGYDISAKAMERAEKIAGIKKADDATFSSELNDFDVYIITVSTHRPDDMFSPQIDGLLSVVEKISREAKKNGALVSIESTIPKGTSKKVFEMLSHRLHVVHAPHRWYALEEKAHGVNQLRVIGGVCDCCIKAGMQFYDGGSSHSLNSYSSFSSLASLSSSSPTAPQQHTNNNDFNEMSLGIPMHPVTEIEIAEITKVIENAHRYLQIAFAEELYLYCQANNINFPELRDALNTKWNVNILEPREGIGGHCLPKDTKMFLHSSKSMNSKILAAAMEV